MRWTGTCAGWSQEAELAGGDMAQRLAILAIAVIAACSTSSGEAAVIRGVVQDGAGTGVAGAIVRVPATDVAVRTDDNGGFQIAGSDEGTRLTAWAPGYFIGGGQAFSPGDHAAIVLAPLPPSDNPDYEWVSVDANAEAGGCAVCHSDGQGLPADEWRRDAHGTAGGNQRFLTMYAGTDVAGNQSPPTRYATHPDYGTVPLPPDPAVPYYGPGFVVDFPGTAGNCGACHLPMAAADDPYGVDPGAVSGAAAEGVGCDFCHKISDVVVGEDGVPLPNHPGVLSIELTRPEDGHQFFAGPFDDVAPGEDTFSPLQLESRFCAPCHFGVFWDTVVYDSYGEWLRSDYSDPVAGRTCQDCHMPPSGVTSFATEDAGGLDRDPATIASHLMPGAADPELLRSALTMEVATHRRGDRIEVEVRLSNDATGHHVPTDSPLRHVILVVEARGLGGATLAQVAGPTLPEYCGVGDPDDGYYAGLAGTAYAKVLEELWTEVAPTGAYWNPTRALADNRIAAHESDTTTYAFAAPGGGDAEVTVRLLYRRAFIDLAEQKGWDIADIEMGSETRSVGGAES